MKIRIVQQGYQTFTGLLGDVKFENGESTTSVSPQQAAYVAAMFVSETIDEVDAEEVTEQSAPTGKRGKKDALAEEAARLAAEAAREQAEAEAAAQAAAEAQAAADAEAASGTE